MNKILYKQKQRPIQMKGISILIRLGMSEKNILANPGGSNSASFESETHGP